VLDEPVSDLDPIARGTLLEFLLELLQEDRATILISSHVLRDVERVVDRVVCLEQGRLTTDSTLDDLKERYAEWLITSRNGELAPSFVESFVLSQEIEGREARLLVDLADADVERFRIDHSVSIESRALNLEEMFPLLVREVSP
jgi:ABC-2 type transport system ATP-binding protein